MALVDVRLNDGVTGPDIGDYLHFEHGVTVVFITGNPEAVRESKAAIGVLQKPFAVREIEDLVKFAVGRRLGRNPRCRTGLSCLKPLSGHGWTLSFLRMSDIRLRSSALTACSKRRMDADGGDMFDERGRPRGRPFERCGASTSVVTGPMNQPSFDFSMSRWSTCSLI